MRRVNGVLREGAVGGPPSSAANPDAAALPSAPSAAVSEQLRAAAGDALVAIRKAEPPIPLAAHQMGKLGGDSRPIQVDFVGLRASNARRIVYVVDASGSLVGSFPQIVEAVSYTHTTLPTPFRVYTHSALSTQFYQQSCILRLSFDLRVQSCK